MTATRPRRARRAASLGVVALLAGFAACYAPSVATAGTATFEMSPAAGPPGTVVHVSGTGCSPGLLGSQQTDFVAVTAPTLHVALHLPVRASGAWQGSFRVPAGATGNGGSAPVAAACVAGGVESLTTVYTPRSFTVTEAAAAAPDSSTTTPGGNGTAVRPSDPAVFTVPPATKRAGATGRARASHHGTRVGAPADARGTEAHGSPSTPAALRPVRFGALSPAGAAGGVGSLGELFLLALLIAASGAALAITRAGRVRLAAIAAGGAR